MTPSFQPCRHCRTPFEPTAAQAEFCCAGCQFIYRLLHERGLEEFYRFGDAIAPGHPDVFKTEDFAWLREWQAKAEPDAGATAHGTLAVQGISCAACVWLLERTFQERDGALSCRVNSVDGVLELRWVAGQTDLAAYAADVRRFGYFLGLPEARPQRRSARGFLIRLGVCGALAMNGMLFALPSYLGMEPGENLAILFGKISFVLATLSLAVGGTYFFRRALGVLRSGVLHIDLPISLGLLFAYAGSVLAWRLGRGSFVYFDFVSIFTFLMLTGRWLQERAVDANRARLLGMRLDPGVFRVAGKPVPAAELRKGSVFEVAREQLIPVRCRLRDAQATIGLSWITGEPYPREAHGGDLIPSGAKNFSPGPLLVEAVEGWPDSQLARLLRVESGSRWQNKALQRVMRGYLLVVMGLAVAGFFGWVLGTGDWVQAFQVLVSVLVVSCPCAVGVALPFLDDLAAASLQQAGIYVKEGSLWERLQRVRHILFDKTGTITLENLALTEPAVLHSLPLRDREVLLGMVMDSPHPIAACLRQSLLADGVQAAVLSPAPVEQIGRGIEWVAEGVRWRLGKSVWAAPEESATDGTLFTREGRSVATLRFREEVRPQAARQIRHLRARGYGVHILSGDQPARVQALAAGLGLDADCARGALNPEEKARLIADRWPDNALMIGDGANDSLAFDAALCRGTPAITTGLLEQKADFYILGQSLAGLEPLFETARRHRVLTRLVFAFAVTYNLAAILTALAGFMSPLVAAIIMPLSSIVSMMLVLRGFRRPVRRVVPITQPVYANA